VLSGEIPTTLAGQLAYAPAALLTSLFRPSIFEVRNLLMLANAVETTVLTVLFVRVLFTRNLGSVRRQIMEDPFLVFCVVFVIAFGIAVGLTSTNLGTLSRYRSPLLPFFVVLLLVLGKPHRARSRARKARTGPETVADVP
jgi:branched-subunit amino acid transport protein